MARTAWLGIVACAVVLTDVEARAGNCFVNFGASSCAAGMGLTVVSFTSDLANCEATAQNKRRPIEQHSWGLTLLVLVYRS